MEAIRNIVCTEISVDVHTAGKSGEFMLQRIGRTTPFNVQCIAFYSSKCVRPRVGCLEAAQIQIRMHSEMLVQPITYFEITTVLAEIAVGAMTVGAVSVQGGQQVP